MRHRAALLAPVLLAVFSAAPPPRAGAQARAPLAALPVDPLPYDQGATGLGLALRKLGATGRVLYVTAHPDDEDSGLLAALTRGQGLKVTLFTLTRGAGGLNEIGPELFQELSVLRTEETAARDRHDGTEQRFGRADDFGYSFSVEECVTRWGREEMVADITAVMRRVRPDVVIVMPLENAGGGAAHSASAQLAAEAFAAAADPGRFPEQVAAGVQPWPASVLYEAGVGGPGRMDAATVVFDTGRHDPLLGMSWVELGSLARARHRTQGMRQVVFPGEGRSGLRPVSRAPGVGEAGGLFAGIDTTVAALAARFGGNAAELRAAQQAAERARELMDARRPEAVVPALEEGVRALRAAAAAAGSVAEPGRSRLLDRIQEEERDFVAALALAMGLRVEPLTASPDVQAGAAFTVQTRVRAAVSAPAIEEVVLRVPPGWTVKALPPPSPAPAAGGAVIARHEVSVPADERLTQPHWHIDPAAGRNRLDDVPDPTLPFAAPPVSAVVRLGTAAGPVELEMPVYAPRARPSGGEERTALRVVPALSVRVDPPRAPFALAARAPRAVYVHVTALGPASGAATARLEAPAGWRVSPAAAEVSWTQPGQEVSARFDVWAAAARADGELRAVAVHAGREFREEWLEIAYPHVPSRPLVRPAALRAAALDLRTPAAAAVGYVEGAGDVVASAIEALGLPVRRLGADDLARGDLSRLGTIVLGVRAYQTRDDLRANNARLLEFARQGGHVVVQLSRAEFNQLAPLANGSVSPAQSASPFAPYPGRVGVKRVADETAPLRFLQPAHPLLTAPHRLGAADFEGWVQERGSFLFEPGDPRYADLLAATDPWPENPGEKTGLLSTAAVGRGSWTYVGLNLFRQLYVGTPGAWRILGNLVARPRGAPR